MVNFITEEFLKTARPGAVFTQGMHTNIGAHLLCPIDTASVIGIYNGRFGGT